MFEDSIKNQNIPIQRPKYLAVIRKKTQQKKSKKTKIKKHITYIPYEEESFHEDLKKNPHVKKKKIIEKPLKKTNDSDDLDLIIDQQIKMMAEELSHLKKSAILLNQFSHVQSRTIFLGKENFYGFQ